MDKYIESLLAEADKLHTRYELAKTITREYFDPGMMEYLDQNYGEYDPVSKSLTLRFEVKGTRYDGRTEFIEKMKVGDEIEVVRERSNQYNPNNFSFFNSNGYNLGNMPAELCNAIAPLYDAGVLSVSNAFVSYVEPITKRSRHAKQAVLFVEISCKL